LAIAGFIPATHGSTLAMLNAWVAETSPAMTRPEIDIPSPTTSALRHSTRCRITVLLSTGCRSSFAPVLIGQVSQLGRDMRRAAERRFANPLNLIRIMPAEGLWAGL
jgi:hypothetical protein